MPVMDTVSVPQAPLLILIDGHALAYRMYFALEMTRMSAPDGQPSWAVYGFFTALLSLLKTVQPQAIVVTFDAGRDSFRTRLYPDYKANREHMPEDMRSQMALITEGVEALHLPLVTLADFEADDLIGTLSHQAVSAGYRVGILTGDQDAFQLVADPGITVLLPPRNPKESLRVFDRQAVFDKWGVYPEQVVDFKALKGDTSDNIPGVPGIGDKTAAKLLAQFGTLNQLYDQLPQAGTAKLQEKLATYKDQALLSQQLALIIQDAPVSVAWDDCRLSAQNVTQDNLWHTFCTRLGFKQFITQYDLWTALFAGQPIPTSGSTASGANKTTPKAANPMTGPLLATLAVPQNHTESEGPPLPASEPVFVPDYTLVQTPQSLADMVSMLQAHLIIALDVETQGLDVRDNPLLGIAFACAHGLQPGTLPTQNPLKLDETPTTHTQLLATNEYTEERAFYVPIGQAEGHLPLATVLAAITPLLTQPDKIKVAHNAKFERLVFKQYNVPLNGLVFDTMIASYVLAPERRHGLKALALNELGLTMTEYETLVGKGKQHTPFAQLPLDQTAPYAAADAAACLRLAHRFTQQLATQPQAAVLLYEMELPLEPVLATMEWNGIQLDVPYLHQLSQQLNDRLQALEADIFSHTQGMPFNLNSPKQVGEVLFGQLGIAPLKKTAGKAHSTDAQVLEQLRTAHPIVPLLLEYRQVFKLKSTYVEALPALVHPLTGRVHTHFNQTVTATGRLSSSNPNLQNIPIRSELGKAMRQAFVPQQGWVLLSADYSQIELRLLAHYAEDPHLCQAFEQGLDVHTATAALVFNVPIAEVTKEQRYKAKTVNFGVVYGQSAHSLGQQLGISRTEAQQFIDCYFMRYSAVKACIEGIQDEAHRTGQVATLFGRTRNLSANLNSRNRALREFAERAAFNTPLQGSAADLIKLAMIRLHHRLAQTQLQARILLQVHDEIVLEAPPDELDELKTHLDWAMTLNQPLRVPLVSDMAEGPNWLEA
jgi:DNA polymerase I